MSDLEDEILELVGDGEEEKFQQADTLEHASNNAPSIAQEEKRSARSGQKRKQ
ncbi:11635_t:CDS:1, partial [Acaulospora morrowiae]